MSVLLSNQCTGYNSCRVPGFDIIGSTSIFLSYTNDDNYDNDATDGDDGGDDDDDDDDEDDNDEAELQQRRAAAATVLQLFQLSRGTQMYNIFNYTAMTAHLSLKAYLTDCPGGNLPLLISPHSCVHLLIGSDVLLVAYCNMRHICDIILFQIDAILENFKWPYLRNGTSDRLRV